MWWRPSAVSRCCQGRFRLSTGRRQTSQLPSPAMARNRWDSDDVIAADAEAKRYPAIEISLGTELTHRDSGTRGTVVAFSEGERIVLEDPLGGRHEYKPHEGAFAHRGQAVKLLRSTNTPTRERRITASGSLDAGPTPAQTAQASRIWVEGIHDAELIEHVWGDDLRVEGIVVEPLHGADDLVDAVRAFQPARHRRLGILLDHLVPGSKEARIAEQVAGPQVMVAGHPYVDIWQAIRPEALGIAAWPEIPLGRPWKEGVIEALGSTTDPGLFWQQIRSRVTTYRDLETPLITAVESLIDFVTT